MIKGYLTVFLSLSLSFIAGFVLIMTGFAIKNAGRVKLEYAADTGMNAVLSEFHIELENRYGLLYIDSSYLGKNPSIENVKGRLIYYIQENLKPPQKEGAIKLIQMETRNIEVTEYSTAAEEKGNSMYYQAIQLVRDMEITHEEANVITFLPSIQELDSKTPYADWSNLQAQLASMELPKILNENNEWEEVELNNPADAIFSLSDSDVLYLSGVDVNAIGVGRINLYDYISQRADTAQTKYKAAKATDSVVENSMSEADSILFLTYIFHAMGQYQKKREGSFLQYQMEYMGAGQDSDWENLKIIVQQMLNWRFADNISCIMENPEYYGEAEGIALSLQAVTLFEDLKEPVARSNLYAWAYLESINDVRQILAGGKIPLLKTRIATTKEELISGSIVSNHSKVYEEGLTYSQYLACKLLLTDREILKMRCMDIIEMDIRYLTGNTKFAMDYCVERFRANITADDRYGNTYALDRSYGYY